MSSSQPQPPAPNGSSASRWAGILGGKSATALGVAAAIGWAMFAWIGGRHGVRAAMIDVPEIARRELAATIEADPGASPLEWRFDDPAALAQFLGLFASAKVDPALPATPERVRALAEEVYVLGAEDRAKRPQEPPATFRSESPLAIHDHLAAGGGRLTCYPTSMLLCAAAQAAGWRARVVNLDHADRMGGQGHTVVEVWLPDAKRWMLADAFYGLAWSDAATNEPLSVAQLRGALVEPLMAQGREADRFANETIEPRLDFFRRASRHKSVEERTADYAEAIQHLAYFANNAFVARHEARYGALRFAAPLVDQLHREPKRAIDRLFGPFNARYHLLDDVAPSYNATAWRRAFRGLLAATFASMALGAVAAVRAWRRRRRARLTA